MKPLGQGPRRKYKDWSDLLSNLKTNGGEDASIGFLIVLLKITSRLDKSRRKPGFCKVYNAAAVMLLSTVKHAAMLMTDKEFLTFIDVHHLRSLLKSNVDKILLIKLTQNNESKFEEGIDLGSVSQLEEES